MENWEEYANRVVEEWEDIPDSCVLFQGDTTTITVDKQMLTLLLAMFDFGIMAATASNDNNSDQFMALGRLISEAATSAMKMGW